MLQHTLIMIQLRHPNRQELEDVNFALFEKYKEYFLGDYCYGLRSSEDSGSLVPPWSLVLSYEHAISLRGGATPRLQGAFRQGAQLQHAAIALHAKRPQPWNATSEQPPTKKGRKGAKGKGKGKNAKGCKNGDKCHFAHVCMLCFGKHPTSKCPKKAAIRTLQPPLYQLTGCAV